MAIVSAGRLDTPTLIICLAAFPVVGLTHVARRCNSRCTDDERLLQYTTAPRRVSHNDLLITTRGLSLLDVALPAAPTVTLAPRQDQWARSRPLFERRGRCEAASGGFAACRNGAP